MVDTAEHRRTPRASGTHLVLLILWFAAVAVCFLESASSSLTGSDQGSLIRGLSSFRVDNLRFFKASASPFDAARYKQTVSDAELFLLSAPDSPARTRIRALIAVGTNRLGEAAEILEKLNEESGENPELLNDLGVVYWGLGQANPSNRFKALMAFERSSQLSESASPPRFNTVLAYRKVRLDDSAEAAFKEYRRLEKISFWVTEASSESASNLALLEALRKRLQAEDIVGADSLVERYRPSYRKIAVDLALNPPETGISDNAVEFVLNYFANERQDETIRALLAPLETESQSDIIQARRLVHLGIEAYFQAKLSESLHFYDLADAAIKGTDSVFDELWIKLNRADSRLRSARSDALGRRLDISAVEDLLNEVIAKSRAQKLNWVLGQALASKSMASMTTRNQDEILPMMTEAVDVLTLADAPEDTARPLYYLAFIHFFAGDSETSLGFIYRSLHVTLPDEHVRLAQLYWLASVQLYRTGFETYAMTLARQAVDESLLSENSGLIASMISSLAMLHVARGEYATAEQYLIKSKVDRDRVETPGEQATVDLSLNLLCSHIRISQGSLDEAQACLDRNLVILKQQAKAAPDFFAQTLLQLSEIHTRRGRLDLARDALRQATEIVEENDAYLATTALRMPFENQRRDLYDTAISFEYDNDGKDAAWGYTQSYRSKLLLEFMRQMNPDIARILDRAVDRSKVQELIPDDVQIVEYVMLKDRLLIWLVSRDKFASVTVPATRADIESNVADFIERINSKGEVRPESARLYKILIEPIEAQLDPKRALAIIPDQVLHRLNFPALYSPAAKSFLIERYTILESPSLTTLLSGRSGSPSGRPAVGFGARTDNTGATSELRALGQFYPDFRTFNDATALKPAFLSSLGSAAVFHYAGHSQDGADPLRSSVLLDGDREGPNSVTAVDISRRRMPPGSVVVLASCDSSVGNSRDGVGMRGLTSAFLISGAGSVVGSLWLVDAQSTSRLMLRFHSGFVRDRLPVVAALRNAQLAFIEEGAHPYYWSGFVVTGNISSLR